MVITHKCSSLYGRHLGYVSVQTLITIDKEENNGY